MKSSSRVRHSRRTESRGTRREYRTNAWHRFTRCKPEKGGNPIRLPPGRGAAPRISYSTRRVFHSARRYLFFPCPPCRLSLTRDDCRANRTGFGGDPTEVRVPFLRGAAGIVNCRASGVKWNGVMTGERVGSWEVMERRKEGGVTRKVFI